MRIHPNILERNRKDFEERGGYAMFAYMTTFKGDD